MDANKLRRTYEPLYKDLFNEIEKLKKVAANESQENYQNVIDEANMKKDQLIELTTELNDIRMQLSQRSERMEPFFREIGPELDKLEELYKLRYILTKIQRIKEIHLKINDLVLNYKNAKQNEIDSKLLAGVDLFVNLTQEYKELKIRTSSTNPLRTYLKDMISYWNEILKNKLELRLEAILPSVNWPSISSNIDLKSTSITEDLITTFKTFFESLLKFETNYLFEDEIERKTSSKYIRLCLPLQIMINPLKKRFIFHFMKKSKTNQLEKPEWYLTQIINWIQDNTEFLKKYVDPIIKSYLKENYVPSKFQLACGLCKLAIEKLTCDLPDIVYEDKLFSHTFDEYILFVREMETIFGKSMILLKQECDILRCFAVEPYFTKLLQLERKKSAEFVESILNSPTAWSTLIQDIDPDSDDEGLKVSECVDSFVMMLQSITERCSYLSEPSHKCAFIKLELEMIDDFRLRLSQLLRVCDENGTNRWPFSLNFFAILNTVNYLIVVLEEWKSFPIFIEVMDEDDNYSLFENTIALFEHMVQELKSKIIHSFMNQMRVKIYPYANIKWFCLTHEDADVNIVSYDFFYFISSGLTLLKKELANTLFQQLCISTAEELNRIFFEDVILKNSFNDEGVKQLNQDVLINLNSIFKTYMPNPDLYLAEIQEACKILTLKKGTIVLLQEALNNNNEKISEKILDDMGIEVLPTELVLTVLKKKLFK